MSQVATSEAERGTEVKSYKNYIGGSWVESKTGRTFNSVNPAHKNRVLGVMQASNAQDVDAAVGAAEKAFAGWRRTPAPARGEIILRAGLLIEQRKEELARLMTQEMGKVLKEARGDVQEAIDMGKYAAGFGRRPFGETVPSELRNKAALTRREPLGVIGCITPWNFPLAIPTWKIFPALMAGNTAIVVLDDADVPLAVDGALWGAFGSSGQRCTAASRLIVQRKVEGDFTDLLQERAAKMKVGDGLLPDTDMGPVINEAALKKVHEYTEIGRKEHARLVHGGDFAGSDGWFYRPTIFADGRKDMRMAQEEIFGPSTLVMPVGSLEEALEVANSTSYGLSLSIYTNDLQKAFHAMDELQSGIVYVNAPTIGAEIHLPFGGTKNTGNGHREAGMVALDEFTEWKTIYVDYSGRLQRAQIDTGE